MVLYASPVWANALLIKKNKNTLKKAQRAALIRSSTAYRAALCVLTDTMRIYYKAELRAEKYELKKVISKNIKRRFLEKEPHQFSLRG